MILPKVRVQRFMSSAPVVSVALAACQTEPSASAQAAGTQTATTTAGDDTGATTTEPQPIAAAWTGACPTIAAVAREEFASRFAEAICAQKAACGCHVYFACVGVFKQQFAAMDQHALANSLRYDEACATQILASSVIHRGCRVRSDFWGPFRECGWSCPVFRGDIPTGEPCPASESDFWAYGSVCAEPEAHCDVFDTLVCKSHDPPTLELGEPCLSPDYSALGDCAEGLSCSLDSLECVPEVGEGETCGALAACAAGLWCDESATCQLQRPAGAACEADAQCVSITCAGGTCVDEPAICLVDTPSDVVVPRAL